MDAAPAQPVSRERHAGSGPAAAPGWLALAAAPTFGAMALWTLAQPQDPALCLSSSASGLGGMGTMYALMALFHVSPWLKVIADRRRSLP